MFKPVVISLLITLMGCGVTASPTPVVIVVTATPNADVPNPVSTNEPDKPTPTASRTVVAELQTPGAQVTADPNLKATDVKYVRALEDINIRKGPGTNFAIAGGVYKGQTAEVTGYQSADGKWWRVVCPIDGTNSCWVSADPLLTEPTDSPNVVPTSAAAVDVEAFIRQLASALSKKNYDGLREMMADPFTIGYWQSEGTQPSREDAIKLLREQWLGPADSPVIDLAGRTDQTRLLNGTNPMTMWDPKVKVAKTVYIQGLGKDGKGEGLLVITERADKTFAWYGMLFAANGFAAKP